MWSLLYDGMVGAEMSTNPITASQIRTNLADVQQRIADAALRANRLPSEVTLVAVSKTKPMSMILLAYIAGQRDFGENRLDELWEKQRLAEELEIRDIRWHFIGTIQSRKTNQVVGPFELIHSIDRTKIINRLSKDAEANGQVMPVLLEVNVSGEVSKHGFTPADLMAAIPAVSGLAGISVQGLMTMAPFVAEPEETRPVFRELRQLQDNLALTHPDLNWHHLSMGMTNDFEVAVEEGATIVRVGSAIFGERDYK